MTYFGLHSPAVYTPKGRGNQFLCKFNSTSNNAALFSNSHKLGIHQPGSLASNGDSQLLSGSGGGGIALCQKGAKYKERTQSIREVSIEFIHWGKIVRFLKADAKGRTASHPNPGNSVKDSVESDSSSIPGGTSPKCKPLWNNLSGRAHWNSLHFATTFLSSRSHFDSTWLDTISGISPDGVSGLQNEQGKFP